MGEFKEKALRVIADNDIEIENTDTAAEEVDGEIEPLMQEPFNPAEINIISKPDILRNIIERLNHDEIDMNTDFQRHAELWNNQKMSRLIESILIRFPLPAFYFDASDDDRWLIVDGLQRLSAIKKFVIDQKLRLHGLEYLKEFVGKKYDDLPRTYKRRIDECAVTLFLIQPGTPEAVKYSIFRRINTGGLVLNDQEIRNAMAKPAVRKYLGALVADDFLIKTIGDQSRRMVDQEMVLRYLAFRFMKYEDSKKNIASFLDGMIDKLEKSSESELNEYSESFRLAIRRCWEIFKDRAFEKSADGNHAERRRKNSTLFEVWMNALGRISKEEMKTLYDNRERLIQAHLDMMATDNDYFRSITYSTQKKDHYRTRRDKVQKLIEEILND
ncbi:MAG: DUF262 domain-containing protein [Desulfobacterium sp.]|jgi:hypothetical protein|nr:DUF262 domain-containing protein [Desulfobacterium sp.]